MDETDYSHKTIAELTQEERENFYETLNFQNDPLERALSALRQCQPNHSKAQLMNQIRYAIGQILVVTGNC